MTTDILRKNDSFYDIESLHDIYTKVVVTPHQRAITLFIHTEPGSDAERFMQEPHAEEQIIKRVKKLNHNFINKHHMSIHISNLTNWSIMMRQTLSNNEPSPARMFGFNSHAYDEPMLAYLIEKTNVNNKTIPTPSELRNFSDRLIHHKYPSGAFGHDYELKNFFNYKMRYTDYKDFIDIKDLNESMKYVSLKRLSGQAGLRIKESSKLSGENAYMSSLDDICELVGYNAVDTINTYLLFKTNAYMTPFKQRSDLLERFKDNYINKLAPDSTSAKFIEHVIVPAKKDSRTEASLIDNPTINVFYPIHVDEKHPLHQYLTHIKEARLSEKEANDYLITMLQLDKETPRYRYNKDRTRIEEDLLEMIKEDYDLPDDIYQMYDCVRGSRNVDEAKTKLEKNGVIERVNGHLSISKNQIIRNSNSYITFSIGGCHGEYLDKKAYLKYYDETLEKNKQIDAFNQQLHVLQDYYGNDKEGATTYLMTKKEETTPSQFEHLKHKDYVNGSYKNGAEWKKNKKVKSMTKLNKEMKKFAKTVYLEKAGHGDVKSLYPTLMTNLGMFSKVLDDGSIYDPYAELLNERLALKAKIEQIPKDQWTNKEKDMNRLQKLNKLLLNAASGVADASFDNNVRVNNKAIGMRVCGQLILSCLVYDLTDAGSTALSTNTDGVYFTPLDKNVTQNIFNQWCKYFNIDATPEIIDLFITKDSNNRIEVNGNSIEAAGSTISLYQGASLSNNINMPVIRDNALVDYLKNYKQPLKSFDETYIKNRMKDMIAWGKTHAPTKTLEFFQWFFVSNPGKNSFMTPIDTYTDEIVEAGKTFRAFIVKESPITMKCIKLTKQNKNTDTYAKQIAENNGFINDRNKNNHIKFGKINNLPEDNCIEVHQEPLDEINISVLDNLDLDTYVDVVRKSWETWSKNHVIM